jgi:hypothetical protein
MCADTVFRKTPLNREWRHRIAGFIGLVVAYFVFKLALKATM